MRPAACALACVLACSTSCCVRSAGSAPVEPESVRSSALAAAARTHTETSLSPCFQGAYASWAAHAGCTHASEDQKRRLSLALANCHLEGAGRPSAPCPEDRDLRVCVRDVTAEAFHAFTIYTTHVDNMCYYLESQRWRDTNDNITRRLVSSANDTAHVLAAVLHVSADLRAAHTRALLETQQLQKALQAQATAAQAAVEERHMAMLDGLASADSQVKLVTNALQQVSAYSSAILYLQGYVVANLLIFQSLAYYAVLTVALWALTASPQTAAARFPAVLGLCVVGILETYLLWTFGDIAAVLQASGARPGWAGRVLAWLAWMGQCMGSLSPEASRNVFMASLLGPHMQAVELSHAQWGLRGVHAACVAVLLLWHFVTYVDYARVNHAMLVELQLEMRHLRRSLRRASAAGASYADLSAGSAKNPESKDVRSRAKSEPEEDPADSSTDSDSVCTHASFLHSPLVVSMPPAPPMTPPSRSVWQQASRSGTPSPHHDGAGVGLLVESPDTQSAALHPLQHSPLDLRVRDAVLGTVQDAPVAGPHVTAASRKRRPSASARTTLLPHTDVDDDPTLGVNTEQRRGRRAAR